MMKSMPARGAAMLLGTALGLSAVLRTSGAEAAETCSGDLPPVCLQSFGAGSAAISAAASGADCRTRLNTYRECISALASDRGIGDRSAPLDRAERGFLSALEAELADNVGRLETFIEEKMNLDGARAIYENDWLALRTRFFDSTTHPSYFSAPADWLARTQGFYDEVRRLLERSDVRNAYRSQTSSILYKRRVVREELEKLVAAARNELLPEISAVLATKP